VKAATKKQAAAKVRPAKPKPGPFDNIDPLPTNAWRLSTIDPKIAADDRAAQLLGLGYPRMFLTIPGEFTGTDEQLRTLANDSRIIPRGALKRIYTASTFPDLTADDLEKAVSELLEYSGNHFAMYALECLYGTVETTTAIGRCSISSSA